MLTDYVTLEARGLETHQMQRLGWDARGQRLAVDGIAGPLTRGATFLDPRILTHPMARAALAVLLAGAQEEDPSGRRRNNVGHWPRLFNGGGGPDATKRWFAETWRQGAWCAGFASYVLEQVHADAPYILGAQRLGERVAELGLRIDDPGELLPGDLIVWDRDGPDAGSDPSDDRNGHVGIVVAVTDDVIYTIEGNRGRYPAPVRAFRYDRARPDMHPVTGPYLFGARWTR